MAESNTSGLHTDHPHASVQEGTGIAWLLFILAGLVVLVFGAVTTSEELSFEHDAVRVAAKVSDSANVAASGNGEATATYSYDVNGETHTGPLYGDAPADGSTVEIEYRKSDPDKSRLARSTSLPWALVADGVGLFALIGGVVLFVRKDRDLHALESDHAGQPA